VAALDIVAGLSVAGIAFWLVGGLAFAVNDAERALRLHSAGPIAFVALVLLVLGAGVLRRARAAYRLQRWLALGALPLLPVGTAWGWYILSVLQRPDARTEFEGSDRRPQHHRPFWGPLSVATALGVASLTFCVLKAREFWLEKQMEQATESVARRQQAVSHRIDELRSNGVVDTASPQVPRVRR
jgi:hypothetical protein